MVQTSVHDREKRGPWDDALARLRRYRRRALFLVPEKLAAWARQDFATVGLWTPVAIGVGAGVYFGLKTEPHWAAGLAALFLGFMLALRPGRMRIAAAALAFVALGFVAAQIRTAIAAAPILERELPIRLISGKLVSIEEGAGGRRLLVALDGIEGVAPANLPARARVTWRGADFAASPGDHITLRAGLGPPPPPAAPGAFDFARQLYFQQIGAVGYAVTPPTVDGTALKKRGERLAAFIEAERLSLMRRITKAAPGEGGAIIAAVVTGKREAVSERSEAALRDAGLAHLLAISGLHMGLATGLVFFSVRLGLAAIEPLALHFPIKKWAAAAALASGAFYLVLSGSSWSARRAFIMAAIFFIAILVNRRALSLRNVAVAATIILLTTPEALFHPGFQMSFAAVTALIAGYEWWSARDRRDRDMTLGGQAKRYAAGLAATDLIAATATAPFALYHFHRVALYSLPANMAAMPIMAFWIMPVAVLALALAPFGLDGWAWSLAAMGMEAILWIAREVSSLKGAVSFAPQWPLAMLTVMTFGGLLFCLARSPLRLLGLAAIPAAILMALAVEAPQLYVAASGQNAGYIPADSRGEIYVYSRRRDRFSVGVWEEAAGFDPAVVESSPMTDAGRCDGGGCVIAIPDGGALAVSEAPADLAEECARADLVVAFYPVSAADWKACKAVLIDKRSVWRHGAHAVRFSRNGDIRIKTAADYRGRRPWTGD